jgi:hypothetical protein
MRLLASLAAAAILFAGLAGTPEDAFAQSQKKHRDYDRYDRYGRYDRWDGWSILDLFPGPQARNPDNFRFGSKDWWRAMDMDGRGGHPRL